MGYLPYQLVSLPDFWLPSTVGYPMKSSKFQVWMIWRHVLWKQGFCFTYTLGIHKGVFLSDATKFQGCVFANSPQQIDSSWNKFISNSGDKNNKEHISTNPPWFFMVVISKFFGFPELFTPPVCKTPTGPLGSNPPGWRYILVGGFNPFEKY